MALIEASAAGAEPEPVITQERERSRWAVKVGDRTVGALTYQFAGHRYVLISTHIDSDYRGGGLATRLALTALDDIRITGQKITVVCPFIGDVIARHPKYVDLVDTVHPGSGISGTVRSAFGGEDRADARVERTDSTRVETGAEPGDGSARIMVLGAIAFRGPLAAAGVGAVFHEWEVDRWATISAASIERRLRALAADGFIEVDAAPSGESQFHCTARGRDELHQLLLRLLAAEDFQPFSLLPLLHFVRVLSPEQLSDGLRRRILRIDEILAYERSVIARMGVDGPPHASEIIHLNWHRYNADRSWSLEFIGRLYGSAPTDS